MRVIVTRPAAQALEWVARLRECAVDAVALPLIAIAPAEPALPLQAAWQQIDGKRLVVFVSPNAAEQFFAHRPEGLAWPASVLAGSPGPGTTAVLQRWGVPPFQVIEPAADSAQFDSESLWLQLRDRDWRDAAVTIVRGDGGREWLAGALADAGAAVDHLTAYRRLAPVLQPDERALLIESLARPERHLWFFSSSEAIDNLAALLPAGSAVDREHASALATHPRIAARARRLGFGRVIEARPSLAAVVACLQSIAP